MRGGGNGHYKHCGQAKMAITKTCSIFGFVTAIKGFRGQYISIAVGVSRYIELWIYLCPSFGLTFAFRLFCSSSCFEVGQHALLRGGMGEGGGGGGVGVFCKSLKEREEGSDTAR